MKRCIQRLLLNDLSKKVIGGEVSSDEPVTVDCKDGELVFVNELFLTE